MGAETPVKGRETKPGVKRRGRSSNQHGRCSNTNCHDNFIKKEKYLGGDPNLLGHVFKTKRNQSEQVANFNAIDEVIKAQVGPECDPFVLESLEKEFESGPKKPATVLKENDTMTKIEEMKIKSKHDKYLN